MNDFTKEELAIIDQSLNVAINEGAQFYATERINLRLKIQIMINNYCDHNFQEVCNERTYSRCTKCQEESI